MARIPFCNYPGCRSCGVHPVPVAKRGGRNAYLCEAHFSDLDSYFEKNAERKGEEKVNGFTFSVELETSYTDEIARMELVDVGYIATSDATVDAEYKSPIYEGLCALSKHCVTIERLIERGQLEIDWTCGTHLHVGHHEHLNSEAMSWIAEYYHELFLPLSRAMEAQSRACLEAFWGRTPDDASGYANFITEDTYPLKHENCINIQHRREGHCTLEFRLAKYRRAEQYMQVVKFARDVLTAIINNFLLHYNDEGVDNIEAYRLHKARLTASKIVKLYAKYTAQ